MAQEHSARLLDGTPVVLKAQRPDAAEQADLDLEIMLRIATTLERNAEWARVVGVRRLARGFADSLREELDYLIEADNMRALRATLDADTVRVPRVYEEFSTARLLVMEEFVGVPVVQAEDLIARLSPEQRTDSASVLLRSVLGQIVTEGVFHADLHPGNVVIWPDGAVGLLDFGSVGRLDADSRQTLALLLWAIDADDPGTATDCVLELLDRPAGLDERELQRSIGKLLARFRGGTGPGGTLKVFSELFTLVIGYHFTVPPEIAAALRSLGALEGTLKHIDPGLDLVAVARSVGRSTMGDLTPARVKDEITSAGDQAASTLGAPSQAHQQDHGGAGARRLHHPCTGDLAPGRPPLPDRSGAATRHRAAVGGVRDRRDPAGHLARRPAAAAQPVRVRLPGVPACVRRVRVGPAGRRPRLRTPLAGLSRPAGPSGPLVRTPWARQSGYMSSPRIVRAPRGLELNTLGWPQEGALRMLMNNLDPEVAEHPETLVVYGGSGRAARSWEAFDAIVATLKTLADDETLLVQSGKPVGVFRTHEWAPRVLIANSNLVGDWATWEHFRELERDGLMMYGQMTAGSWIYIGTQGILQGTYETFGAIARKRFGSTLAGTITLTAGLGGMGGPAAGGHHERGVAIVVECDPSRIARRLEHRYLDVVADDLEHAIALANEARTPGVRCLSAWGNAADVVPPCWSGTAPETSTSTE